MIQLFLFFWFLVGLGNVIAEEERTKVKSPWYLRLLVIAFWPIGLGFALDAIEEIYEKQQENNVQPK